MKADWTKHNTELLNLKYSNWSMESKNNGNTEQNRRRSVKVKKQLEEKKY